MTGRSPPLFRLGASQVLAALKSGEISAEALARACLARIEAREADVRAWAHLDQDLIMAGARAADAGAPTPLMGMPVGVKDVFMTRDLPTGYNSPAYRGVVAGRDAACVSLLRTAGALVFGKTDTVEFAAIGRKAASRNPLDLARTPGASSSGSAAAVADLHIPLALGTQTGGSMIRPASYCGLWAVKPTWGLVCNEGAKQFAPSLDTVGWFARSAEDLVLLHDVFDARPGPAAGFEVAGARIAICRTPVWSLAEEATRGVVRTAFVLLESAGARVVDLDLPPLFDNVAADHELVMRAEGARTFLDEYRARPANLDEALRRLVEDGQADDHAALTSAYDRAAQRRMVFDDLAAGFDAVLAPSATGEAPLGLAFTGSFAFNGLWTLLHAPCVNVPGLKGPQGLPVGLTVTGPRFADRAVLAAAAAIGEVFEKHAMRIEV